MFCAISGSVPEQPVISTKSGHLFEKALIDKYVKETGKCPITQESLSLEDLLPLKVNKTIKPRTSANTSIPGLLNSFHNEWDAVMLELHTVRQQLHQTRQELSHALYQHDAAVRVIARLMRERDDARAALEDATAHVKAELEAAQAKAAAEETSRQRDLPEAVLQDLQEVNAALSKPRKKRPVPDSLATPEELAAMAPSGSFPLHSTTQGGINALDVNPDAQAVVATAGMDGSVRVYDYVQGRLLASLEGHSKRVTGVAYVTPEVLVSSSADKTVRVWRGPVQGPGEFTCTHTLKDHTGEVVAVTAHPSHRYFVSGSADATWAFYDLERMARLTQVPVVAESGPEAYTSVRFHPDGLILGTTTEKKVVRIWEMQKQKNVASFAEHTGTLLGLAFSENGYHLASIGTDAVKIWDLRKLKCLRSISPFDGGAGCASAAFDATGQYLAVGGPEVRVFSVKADFQEVGRIKADSLKKATVLRWGADAKSLLVGAQDHNLRMFAVQGSA